MSLIKELTSKRIFPDSYSNNVLKNIKMLSLSQYNEPIPFGSYTLNIQKYPADIDLIEEIGDCNSFETVIKKLKKSLQRNIKKLKESKNIFVMEIKLGLDERYIFPYGELKYNKWILNKKEFMKNINDLYEKKLLDDDEYETVKEILKKKNLDGGDYDIIYNDILRKHFILRWTPTDIIRGNLKKNGKIFKLEESLKSQTPLKIDTIINMDSKLIEVTNFIIITYKAKNNKCYVLNHGVEFKENYHIPLLRKGLREQIEKLLFSYYHFNFFKAIKRLWSLATHYKDKKTIEKLKYIISGDISLIYKLKSDLDQCIELLEKIKNPPIKEINNQIQNIKSNLSKVLFLNEDIPFILTFFKNIENLNKKKLLSVLHDLHDLLKYYSDGEIKKYIINNIIPLPKLYKPKILRYLQRKNNFYK